MAYTGDQEHWYGPGAHNECPTQTSEGRRCGWCDDCKALPRSGVECDNHKRSEKKQS